MQTVGTRIRNKSEYRHKILQSHSYDRLLSKFYTRQRNTWTLPSLCARIQYSRGTGNIYGSQDCNFRISSYRYLLTASRNFLKSYVNISKKLRQFTIILSSIKKSALKYVTFVSPEKGRSRNPQYPAMLSE